MGCICTYASYYSRHTNLLNSAVQIGLIDTIVAILAGLMIFPAAFSVGINPDSGLLLSLSPCQTSSNRRFSGMPIIGYVISFAFYLLLSMAALTSLISLHEVSTAFFQEELHISRPRAAMIVTVGCLLIGAVCSLSLGDWKLLEDSWCRPLRRLRLCHRTDILACRRTPYLSVHRVVCTKEISERRVY